MSSASSSPPSGSHSLGAAQAGIIHPRIMVIKADSVIWRFASSKHPTTEERRTSDDWYNSPWWLHQGDFMAIYNKNKGAGQGASAARDQGLSFQARQDLAVLRPWSCMDVMVKARVCCDIRVYAGRGAPQNTDDFEWPWKLMRPDPGIQQLFICDFSRARAFLRPAGEYLL